MVEFFWCASCTARRLWLKLALLVAWCSPNFPQWWQLPMVDVYVI